MAVDNASDVMVWAYKESTNLSAAEQAGWLLAHIGPRISAAALGMSDARQLKRWQAGEALPRSHDLELRLPLLFRIAWAVSQVYGDRTAALFLRSANPELDDEAPLIVLRGNAPEEVQGVLLAATQAFVSA